MRIYRGRRRQKGYGVGGNFASFFRSAIPILKKAGYSTAKNWLHEGSEAMGELEENDTQWKPILVNHAKRAAKNTIGPLLDLGVSAAKKRIKDTLSDDEISSTSKAKKVKTYHEPDIFD